MDIVQLLFRANTKELDSANSKLDTVSQKTKEVQRAQDDAGESATRWGAKLGVAISGAVVAMGYFALKTINAMDNLNDLSDATGSSVENLSALQDVAQRTGVEFGKVETALIKFNKVLGEAKSNDQTSTTLKAIGLSAKELREMDPAEALHKTAIALSTYRDDANKARIVQELFGKSIAEMGPYLKDLAEQSELIAKVTKEEAAQAEIFNKQLYAMEANASKAARSMLKDLVPALNEILKTFNDKGLVAAVDKFGDTMFDWSRKQEFKGVQWARDDVARLKDVLQGINEMKPVGRTSQAMIDGWKADAQKELAAALDVAKKREAAYYRLTDVQGGRGKVNPTEVDLRDSAPPVPAKPKDPPKMTLAGDANGAYKEYIRMWDEQAKRELAAQARYDAAEAAAESEYQSLLKRVQGYKDLADPTATYRRELEQLQADYSMGQVPLEAYTAKAKALSEAMVRVGETTKKTGDEFNFAQRVGMTAFQGLENSLVTLATTGKMSFKSLAQSILADIAKMIIQLLVIKPLMAGMMSAFGGGTFSAGFGGALTAKATGGDVMAGDTVLVGEKGPELLKMGSTGGNVIPNHKLKSSASSSSGGVQIGSVQITVQGGNTNAETGQAMHKQLIETMKQIAQGQIAESRRPGGLMYA